MEWKKKIGEKQNQEKKLNHQRKANNRKAENINEIWYQEEMGKKGAWLENGNRKKWNVK